MEYPVDLLSVIEGTGLGQFGKKYKKWQGGENKSKTRVILNNNNNNNYNSKKTEKSKRGRRRKRSREEKCFLVLMLLYKKGWGRKTKVPFISPSL